MITLEQKRVASRDSMRKLRKNPDYKAKERAYQKAYYLKLKEAWAAQQALEKEKAGRGNEETHQP